MSKILFLDKFKKFLGCLNISRHQGAILDMPGFYIREVVVGYKQAEVEVNPYCRVVSFVIVGI
jgi:hypothetical protein